MPRYILTLLLFMIPVLVSGRPYCKVKHYDENDGLSQRLVKGIVCDRDGFIWIATWNGLNRFDGQTFSPIRPDMTEGVYRYSNRIREIRLSAGNSLWCRIDEQIVRFDLDTFKFTDTQAQLEEKLGHPLSFTRIMPALTGEIVARCADSTYLRFPDTDRLDSVEQSPSRPELTFLSPHNRRLGNVGHYRHKDLLLSQNDGQGGIWLITRQGDILHSTRSDGKEFTLLATIDAPSGSLHYGCADKQGNIWLCSSVGAFCITLGFLPFEEITPPNPSMIRATFRDSDGRIWLSESDQQAVALYDPELTTCRYLTRNGKLSDHFTPFGAPIYCFGETDGGVIWLGGKPDGLFRLIPGKGDGFEVEHFVPTSDPYTAPASSNIYDLATDSSGRLWIATMGKGIEMVASPSASHPQFINITTLPDYPPQATSVRRISIIGDTVLLAATTAGLLTMSLPPSDTKFALHSNHPDRATSLGNIAVMDVNIGLQGHILVATESDGINILTSPPSLSLDSWEFRHINTSTGAPSDIAHAIGFSPENEKYAVVVSNNDAYMLDPTTGKCITFGFSSRDRKIRFSDARPLPLGNDRWLLGHDSGAIILHTDSMIHSSYTPNLFFTSASIQNRFDTLLSPSCKELTLHPGERNITLRFSALDYTSPHNIHYSYRLAPEKEWNDLRHSRDITFLDLPAGKYGLEIRSTDNYGRWLDNIRHIRIEVIPTFWETRLAKALYVFAALLTLCAITWIVVYIRRMKRKLHERFEAYLNLPESTLNTTAEELPQSLSINDADKLFMDKVMDFVNSHIADTEVTVDDMAQFVAVSRSSLNRKLRATIGVSPAEFLRESRLKRAESLLLTTDLPVKEIAYSCGFSDLNYFGKCFKASTALTPSAYRAAHTEKRTSLETPPHPKNSSVSSS